MKKFLSDLQKELKKLKMSDHEIEEIIEDHREMIEEALKQGVSEEELSLKFGEPSKLASEMSRDSQKVNVNVEDYVSESDFEPVEGYKLLKTLPVSELKEFQIKLISEDLEIYPYEGENLEIHFKKDIKEKNYNISLENGVFKMFRNSKRVSLFEKETTPDFVVRYPNKGKLSSYLVETVSGDSEIKGANTIDIKLKSTSGDFEVLGLISENAEFNVVSGNVKLNKAQALEVKMGSVSGDFECKDFEVKGNIDMNTVSGDVEFYNVSARESSFRTVSGDLDGNNFYVDKIDLKSVSGDVNIHNQDKSRPITVGRKKTLSGDINIK